MTQKEEVKRSVTDYDIVFGALSDNSKEDVCSEVDSISEKSDAIRIVMEAVERIEYPHFVTYNTH